MLYFSRVLLWIQWTWALSINVYEWATVNVPWSAIDVFNNNRNSANVTWMTVRSWDTFTDLWASIWKQYAWANRVVWTIERSKEIILKYNTTYVFRITNETTSDNVISWGANWYEHIDRN